MTTIVIDVGNARIKWARAEGNGRISTPGHAPHVRAVDHALEALAAALPESVERVVVANVAGDPIAAKLTALMGREYGLEPEFVATSAEALGVRCGYREPARLGVDRWVTIVASHHAAKAGTAANAGKKAPTHDFSARAACVINAGTAMTLDAVDARGNHLGGLIMPGPDIIADALHRHTQRIGPTAPAESLPAGLDLLGRSTDEAVGHGALLGPAAAFDRAVAVVRRELGESPLVFLAGGDARRLQPWLETQVQLRADFVLEGLALFAAEMPQKRQSVKR